MSTSSEIEKQESKATERQQESPTQREHGGCC